MIRTAKASDIAAVLTLWKEAAAEPSHTDDAVSLGRLIDYDPGALLVADEDGRIVGTVMAAWDGWRGSVYRLAVAPSRRRTGLGRRLVGEAERRLTEMGAVRRQAIVVETDAAAVGFWQSSGWVQQRQRLRFVDG